jgi:hypothetical protein
MAPLSAGAFRAVDAFACEAYRAARVLDTPQGSALAAELRRSATDAGAALVSAATLANRPQARDACVDRARASLAGCRYHLYLARRLGLLDLKAYRALAARHDAASRELDLEPVGSEPGQA